MNISCPVCGRPIGDSAHVEIGTLCAQCAADGYTDTVTAAAEVPSDPAHVTVDVVFVDPAAVQPVES